jgi:hypothetical protein
MRIRERAGFARRSAWPTKAGALASGNAARVIEHSLPAVEALLDLQRTRGNAFVQRLVRREIASLQADHKGEKYDSARRVTELANPATLIRKELTRTGAAVWRTPAVTHVGTPFRMASPAARVQRQQKTSPTPGETGGSPNTPVLDPYKGESVNKVGHISAPANQIGIAKSSGVNVRAKPDGSLPDIAKVRYDTEVQVPALDNTGAFCFIIARTGAVGWINKDFVALDPPDAASHLHHITESNLTTILKNEYVDKNLWTLSTGNDYTTLAAAVVTANQGRKGVSMDWAKAKKYKEDNPLKRWLDPWMIDNFAIYHGSKILAGHNIWLPPPRYVRLLQSSGVIGSRPDWINAVVDIGKQIAGFVAGVFAGIFGSLWDTLTGLWDLAEGIINTIRGALDGSLFAAIEEIYNKITGVTWQELKNMVDEVITMAKDAFNDFEKKWNHPDLYQQWYFKGTIIGAVALEVVLAIFTGGASLGAKVLAKIGKYFPRLMKVLEKLLDLADKLPGRRKSDHDRPGKGKDRDRDKEHKDRPEEDRGWEQAAALATVVTETHDLKDTPVETLIPLLNNTIAVKFSEVTRYKATPLRTPHTYKIIQTAKPPKVVNPGYTAPPPSSSSGLPEADIDYSKPLSSSGSASSLVPADQYGVFEGTIPGVKDPVAIKVYPDPHSVFAPDLEGAEAAAKTGYGPKFYGKVDAGSGKQAFAMEKIAGGFPTPGARTKEAIEQAAKAAASITRQTIADIEDYSRKLLQEGYYYSGEVQGLVDDKGRWRPIDFQAIRKLPLQGAPGYDKAVKTHKGNIEDEVKLLKKLGGIP